MFFCIEHVVSFRLYNAKVCGTNIFFLGEDNEDSTESKLFPAHYFFVLKQPLSLFSSFFVPGIIFFEGNLQNAKTLSQKVVCGFGALLH